MSDKPRSVFGRLFNFLWMLVSGVLKLIVMIIVIGSFALIWMGLRSGHGVAVENNTPLILAPTGTLVDQLDEDPGKRIFDSFNGAPPAQSSLRDLISAIDRSEERRVGKEGVSTCRSRWAPYN